MADIPTPTPPDSVMLDSDTSAPSLMSLPVEVLDQILQYLLPDKAVLSLRRGLLLIVKPWSARYTTDWGTESEDTETDTGEDDTKPQNEESWCYDREFRYDKRGVQTAVLGVNRTLYEIGSRILYRRTLKLDVHSKGGFGQYHGISREKLRRIPWSRVPKIIIAVHSPAFMNYPTLEDQKQSFSLAAKRLRNELSSVCHILIWKPHLLRRVHVLFMSNSWDPNTFRSYQDYAYDEDSHPRPKIDGREFLLPMLDTLRLLKGVQEFEIKVPAPMRNSQRLRSEVDSLIKHVKSTETPAEDKMNLDSH